MGMSSAERQRRYRQRHLSDVEGTGARLNLVIDAQAKRTLTRLAACYGLTLRDALAQVLQRTETTLLETLPADQQSAYFDGTLSLPRNADTSPESAPSRAEASDN